MSMAFRHPIFALANQPLGVKLTRENSYYSYHSRTQITISSKLNIHISETGKDKETLQMRHGKALKEVKHELINKARKNADEGLYMVDAIQRLGIEHHFEEEIDAILKWKHLMLGMNCYQQGNDYQELSKLALQFRLLRQQGYYVHTDIFDKCWDIDGKLKQTFCDDICGLIALFEASQLSLEGEKNLQEAGEFSRQYLHMWLSRFQGHPQAKAVAHLLQCPFHKTLPKFTPAIIDAGWNNNNNTSSLQELSKLDTQMVGSLHLKEIFAVSKWWKELGLTMDLKFVRDEPIKWYMWPMACIPDPRFSEERIDLTKPISLIYIIDDIFDFCGSIDELTLFRDAVKRWDKSAAEQLPDYMKQCFRALYDITNELAFKSQLKHGWNPISIFIKSWTRLCDAFLEEAKWFASGYVPKSEEYLNNGIVSTGVHVILVHAFFFMGQGITQETVSLMDDFPKLVSSTATILRLCDDLEGHKEDKRDGNDGSYLRCYMKEKRGVSIEESRRHVNELISDAWKQLNQECLMHANPFPSSFTKLCLNSSRVIPLMYSYDTNTPSKLEDYVKSLLQSAAHVPSTLPKEDQDQTLVL